MLFCVQLNPEAFSNKHSRLRINCQQQQESLNHFFLQDSNNSPLFSSRRLFLMLYQKPILITLQEERLEDRLGGESRQRKSRTRFESRISADPDSRICLRNLLSPSIRWPMKTGSKLFPIHRFGGSWITESGKFRLSFLCSCSKSVQRRYRNQLGTWLTPQWPTF